MISFLSGLLTTHHCTVRRKSLTKYNVTLEDSNGGLSAEDLRDFHNQGRREQEDGSGIISPHHPLDHFANLGIASRAPSRRGSPKPSQTHQRYRNSAIRTSPPSRAHSPPPLTFGQHQRQHVVLPHRLLCCLNRRRYRNLRLPEMSRVLRSLVHYRCLRPAGCMIWSARNENENASDKLIIIDNNSSNMVIILRTSLIPPFILIQEQYHECLPLHPRH